MQAEQKNGGLLKTKEIVFSTGSFTDEKIACTVDGHNRLNTRS